MAKFFTADWHLSEKKTPNTWSYHRDFDSPEQMNDCIIQKINKFVGEDDELYVLGDVAVDPNCEYWLQQIKCKNMYLIMGDKDDTKKYEWVKEIYPKYFKSPWSDVMKVQISTLPDKELILSHKPSDAAHYLNQTINAATPKESLFGLFGHTHRAKAMSVNKNMLSVSCDLWDYVPLSEERIAHLFGAVTKYWDAEVYNY